MNIAPEQYIELISSLASAVAPRDALHHTFRVLEKSVAFDTALLLFQDRAEKYIKIVLEYNKTHIRHTRKVLFSAKGRVPIGRDIFGPDYKQVHTSSGANERNARSGIDLTTVGYNYESGMAMLLHVDEADNVLMILAFLSSERDAFGREQADGLNALRPALERMTYPFFLSHSESQILLRPDGALPASSEALLRRCPSLRPLMRMVDVVAPTESTVLIHGPTGAGKGLVAETLHMLSQRARSPFVQVNCASLPETLLESELFGFEKGAFTGAQASHRGYFEQANHGTLFLDEIGELSPTAQAKLLQALEKREITRLGGERRIPVNIRLIAATHRDLDRMVAAGTFREDLLYRLRVFPLKVPPLEERKADISVLAEHFYNEQAVKMGGKAPRFARSSLRLLEDCRWPGNVRQLSHCMERAILLALANGWTELRFDGYVLEGARPRGRGTPEELEAALAKSGWRIQGKGGAAELLQLPPATVRSRMKKLGLPLPGSKKNG